MGVALVSAVQVRSAVTVLAGFVLTDFDISRSQFGWVFALFSVAGIVMSRAMSSLADRASRRALVAVFLFSAAGSLVTAWAWSYPVFLLGMVIGGGALAGGNPTTNRMVRFEVPLERRGIATGLKQSGPQLGLLLSGITLPPVALAFGWKAAMLVGLTPPLIGLAMTGRFMEPVRSVASKNDQRNLTSVERALVAWLAVTGLVMAAAASSMQSFLPLYSMESVGLSASAGGLVASAYALGGVCGRIGWSHQERRMKRSTTLLITLPFAGTIAAVGVVMAAGNFSWLIPVVSFIAGSTIQAWHALAWLFIINNSHSGSIGRSSGIMQIGFFSGFAIGPLFTGYLVDFTGGYGLNWLLISALFAVVGVMTMRVPRLARRQATEIDDPAGM